MIVDLSSIEKVVEYLSTNIQHPQIVSIIGAGISKASGMPTFRGEDGLWNNYQASDLATPEAFERNPQIVWEWYRARMRILLNAKPNNAHFSLTKLEKIGWGKAIITQNVDGLHELAGSKNVIEIHGQIRYARCTSCDYRVKWDNPKDANAKGLFYCPKCNALLRPDVVWFGETLSPQKLNYALEQVNQANIVLVIGTSGVVYPVADFPVIAKEKGKIIIEFNTQETPITNISDYTILEKSEESLPLFVDKLVEQYDGELNE